MKKAQTFDRWYFVAGDPLTHLFRKRLKLGPGLATLIIVLVLNIPILIAAIINNAWNSTPTRVGILRDYSWWISNITSVPATIFFFFWLPDSIYEVINGLQKNKIISQTKSIGESSGLEKFLTQFWKSYSNIAWLLISFVLVAMYMVLFSLPIQQAYKNWQTSGTFIFWYTVFYWLFVFVIGSLFITRGIISILWFNHLFKSFDINIRILHPDGAGGLSPLGKFSVKIGYLLGIYGIASVAATFSESYVLTTRFSGLIFSPALLPLLITYLVMAPIAFFAPIGAARAAMKKAKNNLLLEISDQLDSDKEKLLSLLHSKPAGLKQGIEKIEQIQKIHKIVSGFPVWPFNADNLVRFFTSVSSPVILGLLSLLLDVLK